MSADGEAHPSPSAPEDRHDWLRGAPMDPAATPPEPVPTLGGFPFLQAGSGAVIVGPTGGGRSSLIQACMYDGAGCGLRAAYLGCEVTEPEFNARAARLATLRGEDVDDELRARLASVRYLHLASAIVQAWEDRDAWVEGVTARYQVLAIDPLSAVASALDLDFDQRNAEFIRFYDKLIAPLTAAGVSVVMVDNLGHSPEAKSRAKGVSAKSDRADLTFSCATATKPIGLIIKAQKVRSIRAAFQRGDEWLFSLDTQRIERRTGGEEEEIGGFRPTALMQRVSEAVEAAPGLTRNAILAAVGGKKGYATLALELLISEGYIDAAQDGQAKRHRSVKSYREADETATEAQPGPNRGRAPVPATGALRGPVRYEVPAGPGPGSAQPGPTVRGPARSTTSAHRSTPALAAVDDAEHEDQDERAGQDGPLAQEALRALRGGRAMTLPRQLVRSIAHAVEARDGDTTDVDDLVAVWERLAADQGGRIDRLQYEAAHAVCRCADGGLREGGERCRRCFGDLGVGR